MFPPLQVFLKEFEKIGINFLNVWQSSPMKLPDWSLAFLSIFLIVGLFKYFISS